MKKSFTIILAIIVNAWLAHEIYLFINNPEVVVREEADPFEEYKSHPELDLFYKNTMDYFETVCNPDEEARIDKATTDFRNNDLTMPRIPASALAENLKIIKPRLLQKEAALRSLLRERKFQTEFDKLNTQGKRLEEFSLQLKEAKVNSALNNEIIHSLQNLKLLSYPYGPRDHQLLRSELPGISREKKFNIQTERTFLYDGAHIGNYQTDQRARVLIDNLLFHLPRHSYSTEDLKNDLMWLGQQLKQLHSKGSDSYYQNLLRWQSKIKDQLLLTNMHTRKGKFKILSAQESEVFKKIQLRSSYQRLIQKKYAETYLFWTRLNPTQQSLFTLTTILVHEVGYFNSSSYDEAMDVAQVVYNRTLMSPFNELSPHDPVFKAIVETKSFNKEEINSFNWLNTMFKHGQFSFTYAYMPSATEIFCRGNEFMAMFERMRYAPLALHVLNNPRSNFPATHYYSRQSMSGRIDMSMAWKGMTILPERPGLPVSGELKQEILKSDVKKLFILNGSGEEIFNVVGFKGERYIIKGSDNPEVFYYRDPDRFRFYVTAPKEK